MHRSRIVPESGLVIATVLGCGALLLAQAHVIPVAPSASHPETATSPATKLESFKPSAGSLVTFGYDELGQGLVSVDARELRDSKGLVVRGLVVEVYESQYRSERSFVDADEIPELLKGIDALLVVKTNPTQFKNFEVRYTTRGELELVAFNNSSGKIAYAVRAGRLVKANRTGLDTDALLKLRGQFEAGSQKLASLSTTKQGA